MATKKPEKRVKAGTSKASAAARLAIFIEAYIANGRNGAAAAIAAGYSAKTADQQASRLLRDVKVQQELKARQDLLAKKFELRTEDVLRELARIVHADPRRAFDAQGNLLPIHQWPDDVAAMIASVEVDEIKAGDVVIGQTKKIKIWDKNSAIDKAMKHLGQYAEDNKQRNPIQEMSEDALERFIARKSAEIGKTVH